MSTHPVLLAGRWQPSTAPETFRADNAATGESLSETYPTSQWSDVDAALTAAAEAAPLLRQASPSQLAKFLSTYADRIQANADAIIAAANAETALPITPRLKDIELPRTLTQLRQGASAAEEGTWSLPVIDTKNNIRSHHAPLGPILVIGPNNFPLAFNAISGGDFTAAIAAGNPVIAKGHPNHPSTTRLLAEQAVAALEVAGLPKAAVQLIYHMSPDTGLRAVADPRLAAVAFTGSRKAGLALKAAADKAGKPAYLEMSSLNPVLILPGALRERPDKIADEFADSALAATGQFCTNPGLTLLLAGKETDTFIAAIKQRFESRKFGPLLSKAVCSGLKESIRTLASAGAKVVTPAHPEPWSMNPPVNTLLTITASQFLDDPHTFQTEAFGNASLFVIADNADQLAQVLSHLEGNLTGCLYTSTTGEDDSLYNRLAPALRRRVGRLLNDKMPTGVALSPAMNHGGPYPSTGHPGFTAVGIPASLRRFSGLESYDAVRANRLPPTLQNKNPINGDKKAWRSIDGRLTQDDVAS